MLPTGWSDDSGPQYLHLPADLPVLFEHYRDQLAGGPRFEKLLRTAVSAGADLVMVERNYIDADYRDEFAHFYAQTFRSLPDRCQRLHFINNQNQRYLGFSVMRPVTGRPISRSVLEPPEALRGPVSCLARSQASPYGYRFGVRGFPFISQDYQYGVCAHAAIWMVAHYFHLRFRRPRIYMSDIVEAARGFPGTGHRHTPSAGLTGPQMGAALDALQMPAIGYRLGKLPLEQSAEQIACRYLNSRLPVIVLGSDHARVLIGYGAKPELFFVCHDDARGPYRPIEVAHPGNETVDSDELEWEYLLVPLPGRIYLAGEAAEAEATVAFRSELRQVPELKDRLRDLDEGRLRLRTYVIEAAEYKHGLRSRGLPPEVVGFHARVSLSHWVWVVELQDRKAAAAGRQCVIGEIVIDATSDDRHPNFLCGNLPRRLMRWPTLGAATQSITSSQADLYMSGAALHSYANLRRSDSEDGSTDS